MNRPPKPRTISQEIAATIPTIPAPKDPREEPPSDPSLDDAVKILGSDAPPADRDRALVLVVKKLRQVSDHDGNQDLTIESLRADLIAQAERLGKLERNTSAQSETLGGHAAEVAKAEAPPAVEALPTAELARPVEEKKPDAKPVTVVSRLDEIKRASGTTRIVLVVVLIFEAIRWAAPFIEPLFRGGHS